MESEHAAQLQERIKLLISRVSRLKELHSYSDLVKEPPHLQKDVEKFMYYKPAPDRLATQLE